MSFWESRFTCQSNLWAVVQLRLNALRCSGWGARIKTYMGAVGPQNHDNAHNRQEPKRATQVLTVCVVFFLRAEPIDTLTIALP